MNGWLLVLTLLGRAGDGGVGFYSVNQVGPFATKEACEYAEKAWHKRLNGIDNHNIYPVALSVCVPQARASGQTTEGPVKP